MISISTLTLLEDFELIKIYIKGLILFLFFEFLTAHFFLFIREF